MVRGPSSLLDLRLIEEDSSLHHGIILDEGEFLWSLRYILSRCVKETCPGRRKELDGDGPTLPPGHSKDSRGVHDGTLSTSMYSFWRSISSTISELLSTGSYKRAT